VRAHAVAAFVAVAAASANAAPLADVVVAWGPEPLGKVGEAVGDAATRAGASYIDASPAATPLPDPRPLVKRGIAAYGALEFEAAASALDAAADLVDQTGAAGLDTTTLADLYLYRSLAREQRADDTRAWEDLLIAASIDPTRALDPAGFAPRAIERFAQAKAHVAALPRAKLTFTRVAEGACRVRIDAAPVTTPVLDLPFGKHWLDAACPGRVVVRRRLDVDRPALEVAVNGAPIAPPTDADLVVQARTAAARAIVVVTVQANVVVVRRIGIDGKQQDRATATADDPRAVGAVVARLLAPVERVAQPWYKRRWVWGLAGALAASALLIPLAARAGGEAPAVIVRPTGVPKDWSK
jgi:hypothetical protein